MKEKQREHRDSKPMTPRRVWDHWRIYGVPRCYATDFATMQKCGRLMWPWQEFRGNGEEPRHAECQNREDLTFEEMERREETEAA